ncbi:MAG TPA: PAS domain-containing protein, partial [Miltoncostaeaceae bacterium]|nr:PAS domain-containing protein [Miltoncostaeaceae bacterium]
RGPFVARFGETHNQILQLQGFLVLSSFVVLLVATALDLRRAQRDALEEARASLHNLVENSPDMILRYDRDRRVVFANRALSQAVDRPLSEIIGRPLFPRETRAEELAGWERALEETFRRGMPGQTEFRHTTDGREVVYQSWLIPERDASGAIDTVLVISRNVTAERTATARLQATLAAREASERRYRSVVGLMNGGLVLQARDGRIVECNPAAERILGLSRDQMLGRTSIDPRWRAVRADGSPLPGEEHAAMRTLATGEPITGEVMGVHTPDGGLTWISVSTQTLPASDADDPAVIASFTEITERLREENDQVALRRVAVLVASVSDPRTTHDAIAHEAATMLNADRAVFVRVGLGTAVAEPLGWWSTTPRSGPIHGVPHPFDRDSLIGRLVADPT